MVGFITNVVKELVGFKSCCHIFIIILPCCIIILLLYLVFLIALYFSLIMKDKENAKLNNKIDRLTFLLANRIDFSVLEM